MDLQDYIKTYEDILDRIKDLGVFFDKDKLAKELEALESQMHSADFWNNQSNAKRVTQQVSILKDDLEDNKKLYSIAEELTTYVDILQDEWNNELFNEAVSFLHDAVEFVEKLEVKLLLNGKYDMNNAILTIHPGAGGTESQDWAEMLLRMFKRWAERSKYGFNIVDFQAGDEAGVKSATVEITGEFAYGYLKGEAGVHRLVRISPFNAQGKRQTSFTSIYVYPMIDDDIEVEINPSDLKVDTYRASGAGGQHVNTTDSAVRITHIPTNIIVQCQNERSQIQNREKAMQMLKSRLFQLYEQEREKERQKTESSKTEIGWGNQIRSYVFAPYQMVKDHRTNYETGNISPVMDGEIDEFINAFLKWNADK
ncbi:MAG TPA: peptide chain release factor 2 [Candidatus Cloacimonadota bacterium]|nr:peptide chain release factor 2 [Candidatus Cloacimonadota bacterium]HOQ80420.1 peptide chain release factor 2 [Candidatus Cloacimonadota bacterium]HPK41371.1 peptide chain release factor 2 [Candidatus Cloacimonadota bacterium]